MSMVDLGYKSTSVLIHCLLLSSVTSTPTKVISAETRKKQIESVLGDRNTSRLVLPFEKTVIVDGTKSSSSIVENSKKLLALIVVISQPLPEEQLRRNAIRNSWARWAPAMNMKVVFFLGMKTTNSTAQLVSSLMDEITHFGDIIIDNIEEDYFQLTAKILRSFKWFLKRYSNENLRPTFFLKTDADVFFNLRHLADILQKVPDPNNFIGGHVCNNTRPYRKPTSKWHMPWSYWPENKYPNYTLGQGYMISSALLPVIYKASLNEKLLHFEDLYITGIISNVKLKLKLTHLPGFIHVGSKVTKTSPDRENNFVFHFLSSELSYFTDLYNVFESN